MNLKLYKQDSLIYQQCNFLKMNQYSILINNC